MHRLYSEFYAFSAHDDIGSVQLTEPPFLIGRHATLAHLHLSLLSRWACLFTGVAQRNNELQASPAAIARGPISRQTGLSGVMTGPTSRQFDRVDHRTAPLVADSVPNANLQVCAYLHS